MQQPEADANAVASLLANRIASLELELAVTQSKLDSAIAIIDALQEPDPVAGQ